MESKIYIKEEIKKLSPSISGLENKTVYSIPDNYFIEFPTKLINNIKAGKDCTYYFPNSNPYVVPENYFEHLPESILLKINAQKNNAVSEELEKIAPLLNTISKKPVFSLPKGYFNGDVFSESKPHQPSKVISLSNIRILRFAVAAVFIGLIGCGLFFIIEKGKPDLQANNNKTEIRNLTDDDIVEFLSTGSATEGLSATAANGTSNNAAIQNAVKEISDEEIKQYLQDNDLREGI